MIWLVLVLSFCSVLTFVWAIRSRQEFSRDLEYLSRRQTVFGTEEPFPLLFCTLAQALDAGVIVVDAHRVIRYCNQTAATMFGVSIPEAVGHGLITMLRNYHADLMIAQSIEHHEPQQMTLNPILSQRTIRIWSEPEVDNGGALLIARDLTQLNNLERARRDLVANVSHELRTPLTSIKLLVETLQTAPPPPVAQRMLSQVHHELEAVMHLVDELHELSRIESGRLALQFAITSVEEVITNAYLRIEHQAERKNIRLSTQIAPDLPPVYIDRERMSQVLLNLLHNAIKWTEPEGQICIYAQQHAHAELSQYLTSQQDTEQWVTLSISDTGAGIPAADLGRIFERFYKVDRARTRMKGGTGLGLAIVKHLVEGHGGVVWATSIEGQGSTFTVALPSLE